MQKLVQIGQVSAEGEGCQWEKREPIEMVEEVADLAQSVQKSEDIVDEVAETSITAGKVDDVLVTSGEIEEVDGYER